MLWESGTEGRIADDNNATVLKADGAKLTVKFGWPTTVPYLLSKVRPSVHDSSGGMVGVGWAPEYAHADQAYYGGITVLRGTGTGQTRLITDLLDDNMTLVLDSPFGVAPDADSAIVVWGSCVHSVVPSPAG